MNSVDILTIGILLVINYGIGWCISSGYGRNSVTIENRIFVAMSTLFGGIGILIFGVMYVILAIILELVIFLYKRVKFIFNLYK